MSIVSELYILMRVVTTGQAELSRLERGFIGLDAASRKAGVTQQQLTNLETAATNARNRAAQATANISKVISAGKQSELKAQNALNAAYANQALNVDQGAAKILAAQNNIKNSRDRLSITTKNLGLVQEKSFKDEAAQVLAIERAELQVQKAKQDVANALPNLRRVRSSVTAQAMRDAESVAAAEGRLKTTVEANAAALASARNAEASAALTAIRAEQAVGDTLASAGTAGSQALARISSAAKTVVTNLGKIATIGATLFGGLIAVVTGVGVAFDAMRQKAEVSFGAILGGANQGKQFVADLYDWVRTTALGFEDVTNAAQEFLARGFQIGEIKSTLQAVGDQASALSKPFNESLKVISFNLGQIHSSAILQQRDMRDLANAGVKAWEYLAAAENTSVQQLRQDLASHKKEITGAFAFNAIVTGMEHDFHGMLQVQTRTFSGMVEVGKRTFSELSGVFAQPLFDKLSSGLQKFDNALRNTNLREQVAQWGQAFAGLITAFTTGLIPSLSWIINNKAVLIGAIAAMGLAFAWVHPIVAAFVGLGLAITAIGILKTRSDELPPSLLAIKIKLEEIIDQANRAKTAFDKLIVGPISFAINISVDAINKAKDLINDIWNKLSDLAAKAWAISANIKFLGTTPEDIVKVFSKPYDLIVNLKIGGTSVLGDLKSIVGAALNQTPLGPLINAPSIIKNPINAVNLIPGVAPVRSLINAFGGTGGNAQLTYDQRLQRQRSQLAPELEAIRAAEAKAGLESGILTTSLNQQAGASQDAAAASKSLEQRLGDAFSSIDSLISAAFKTPTREQATAQLAFDESARSFAKVQQAANEQTFALDAASRAIDRNRYALSLQRDKLDEQSYSLSEKSYALQQQIADIQRRNRPAPANSDEARINALQDQIALIDKQQHGVSQQQHKLDLLDKAYADQQKKLDQQKQTIQDSIDKQKQYNDQLGFAVTDLQNIHKIEQDRVTLAQNLPTENMLVDFVNNSLIPFVKNASQQLVDISGGIMQSILAGPLEKVSSAFNDLATDQIPQVQTALANLLNVLEGNPQPRALGGPLLAGVPYLFGERGPEIGIFGQNGYMYPNSKGNVHNSKRVVNLAPITINQYIGNGSQPESIDMFKRIV